MSLWVTVAALAASLASAPPVLAQTASAGISCPGQPLGVDPGVYASSLRDVVTFSKNGETLELQAGRTGFADEPRLTCLDETPEFIRRDKMPAPGEFGAQGSACGFAGGAGGDEAGMSSEWSRMEHRFVEEIERFVKDGYPTNSIIMHAVASGLTIDKTVFLMTRADSDRAEEFFNAAFLLEDSLPGWACGADTPSSRGGPYANYYDVNDLPPRREVAEVARRYFEEFLVMEPQPDWFNGDFHMLANVDELVDLANDEYWYQRSGREIKQDGDLARAIMVSLYGETEEIVLDVSRDELLDLQQRGKDRVPVVFYFNKDFQRAVTDVRADANLVDVIGMFNSEGAELTPVPLLGFGDHHLVSTLEQLADLFEIPERDEIDPLRFAQLSEELVRDGFSKKPVVVTLYSEQDSRWIDDPERLRAAMELGIEEAPVALLYHRLERLPCGATPSCIRRVCEALTCAGGAPSACQIDPAFQREAAPETSPPPPSEGGVPSES